MAEFFRSEAFGIFCVAVCFIMCVKLLDWIKRK